MKKWEIIEKKLTKNFEHNDFAEALSFINKIGVLAEEMNHHPDILLYDYKFVRITLFTHSKKMITNLDQELAEKIDKLKT
jgi:4a-hydroxytetrahydrobiopterin dehydratase